MPATSPLGYIPTSCPICKEHIWSGELMTSPVPRRLYEEHLRRNHPGYLQWDNRTKTLSVPVIIADAAFLLLLVGSLSGERLSGDTSIFGSLLAISLAITSALLVVRLRGKRGFQRVWIEKHGPPLGTGSDSSLGHETPLRRAHQESQVPRIIFETSRSGCPRLDSQCEEERRRTPICSRSSQSCLPTELEAFGIW